MEPIVKDIALANGLRLQYAEQGDAEGTPPLVLLHGIADSWRIFGPLLAELPNSVHAYALSQRGHGDSDRPDTGYRTQDFMEICGCSWMRSESKRPFLLGLQAAASWPGRSPQSIRNGRRG